MIKKKILTKFPLKIFLFLAFVCLSVNSYAQEDPYDSLKISKVDKEKIEKLITSLGEKGVVSLLLEKSKIEKLGKDVNHVHPLRFLGTIFSNPYLKKCICTNGLLLPEKVMELKDIDVKSITVTINAVDPEIASQINSHIIFQGEKIRGLEGAKILVENQLEGVKMASNLGFLVKVNCVLIPGLNMDHVRDIAYEVEKRGAHIFNIMPLIPLGRFTDIKAPSCDDLILARERAERIIPIFRVCKQCRADSCGVPGYEG